MYVELEEVEEGIVDEVDRAVDVFLGAEDELERSTRFVACWKWDVGELARGVGDVLTSVTVGQSS